MTRIPWAHETVNPIVGCSKVSEGCSRCYAQRTARRLCHALPPGQTRDAYRSVIGEDGRWNGKTAVVDSGMEKLRALENDWKPKRVFVGSMTDLFHESVVSIPPEQNPIIDIFGAMQHAEQHTFLPLTKRPENVAWLRTEWGHDTDSLRDMYPNIWLGVTAENQEQFDRRVAAICDPASPSHWPGKKFVSIEPMLGPVELRFGQMQTQVEWVIAGCESGPKRRPAEVGWFRSLRDQCEAAAVPLFLKQMEPCRECYDRLDGWMPDDCVTCDLPRGVVEMPRLTESYLDDPHDGRQWAEVPEEMP